MSWKAVAWATDQKAGSAAAKLVLLYIAEHVNPESHLSWPSVAHLADVTEQDERTVRKALKALEDAGHIADTSRRVGRQKNVTVWRMPRFEAHLDRLNPDKNVGDRDSKAAEGAQDAEESSNSSRPITGNSQPSQICQGSGVSTLTNLQPNPDKNVSATPTKLSGESHRETKGIFKSADSRAIPSGSRAAPEVGKAEYQIAERINHWRRVAGGHVIAECRALDISSRTATAWSDLPAHVQQWMRPKIETAVTNAVERERPPATLKHHQVEQLLQQELTAELKQFRPIPASQLAAAAACEV